MNNFIEKNSKLILSFLIIGYVGFMTYVTFSKFYIFRYFDFDLAYNCQILWNILRGNLDISILEVNFLGNHFSLIMFLLAPLYALFSTPLLLLFLQTLSIGLGVIPIYILGKEKINVQAALTFAILYFIYPPLVYMNLFEFHPVVFANCFLLWALLYFNRNKFLQFLFFLVLALMCQENIALIVFMFGVYALIKKKQRKWIILPMISGVIWFILCVKVIMPPLNKGSVWFSSIYGYLGKDILEVIKNAVFHPFLVLKIISAPSKLNYLFQMFYPVGFLSFLNPATLLISLPIWMQRLLSIRGSDQMIYFHYAAELIPFIFISAVEGFAFVYRKKIFTKAWILLLIGIIANIQLGPYRDIIQELKFSKCSKIEILKEDVVKTIPGDASVVSTFQFLSRLANRKELYTFHYVLTGGKTMSNIVYRLPDNLKYGLIDFDEPLIRQFRQEDSDLYVQSLIADNKFYPKIVINNTVFFQNNKETNLRLYDIEDIKTPVDLKGQELSLESYRINFDDSREELLIETSWLRGSLVNKGYYYLFIFIIDKEDKIIESWQHPLCYGIYPAYRWSGLQKVTDYQYLYFQNQLKPGNYRVVVSVSCLMKGRFYFSDYAQAKLLGSFEKK